MIVIADNADGMIGPGHRDGCCRLVKIEGGIIAEICRLEDCADHRVVVIEQLPDSIQLRLPGPGIVLRQEDRHTIYFVCRCQRQPLANRSAATLRKTIDRYRAVFVQGVRSFFDIAAYAAGPKREELFKDAFVPAGRVKP